VGSGRGAGLGCLHPEPELTKTMDVWISVRLLRVILSSKIGIDVCFLQASTST
jgi:hypothetical protein